MDTNKNWMLITYYCPTHGDLVKKEPIELTIEELRKTNLKRKDIKEP